MKPKLLLPALLLSVSAFAQQPINSFYNFTASPGGTEEDLYTMVTSAVSLNEVAAGANMVWNFNQLTETGNTVTEVITPDAGIVATYPGTTMVVHTTTTGNGGGSGETYYYLATTTAGAVSLTGAQTSGIELNYSTNAFIGTFPLNYGYTNTAAVAGTFDYQGVSGTFTGTGTSAADAYGTLTVNVGIANAMPVTRLKTVQDLNLVYMGAPVGTLTQTIYSYYAATPSSGPIFRSITSHINVPIMSIDQTVSSLESYFGNTLGVNQSVAPATISIMPNPVANVLHFSGSESVNSVTVTDASGRVVLTPKAANDIDVSGLSTGVYYVSVQSGAGVSVQKMVKQ